MTECTAPRGSQRWLQLVVNRCPKLIDNAIGEALGLGQDETIEWLSPLESDCFREYRDHEFLERLGITSQQLCRQLKDFWPRSGPRWDGLARTSGRRRLLIEAKANIPEFDSSPTGASEESLRKIEGALEETRQSLGITSKTDWTKCFYQYANRLAHLYFLKEVNKVNATLVFVYFVGDTTVRGREPVSKEGWEAAIALATHHLGIGTNSPSIRDNVADVFIDIHHLRHVPWPQCD